ncbi:hypothetical protein C2G38_2176010 [Gigaspora rosea]|uniref:Uncharacterized protein n=1 Tax=Gigaspora rosea TaxID=44941 RepID=A0A397VP01_9GLOM|nr:hypothetical protein C2G38_2176010 [Gigaspora rosea]
MIRKNYRIGSIAFREGGLWESELREGELREGGLWEGVDLGKVPVLARVKSFGDKYTQQLFERKIT